MIPSRRFASLTLAAAALAVTPAAVPQQKPPAADAGTTDRPYMMEWSYRVKWGYGDEFWQIFKKYQIATLDREKELGFVKSYEVYRPALHMGEDTRWDFRVVITYKNIGSSTHGSEVEKQIFPDQATMKREENHRLELTLAHYDVPIRMLDPNGDGRD